MKYKLTAAISTEENRCMGACPNLVREKMSPTAPITCDELPFCSLFGVELKKSHLQIDASPIYRCDPCRHVTNRVADLEGC